MKVSVWQWVLSESAILKRKQTKGVCDFFLWLTGSQWQCCRMEVTWWNLVMIRAAELWACGGNSGETKEERVTVINEGGDKTVNKDGAVWTVGEGWSWFMWQRWKKADWVVMSLRWWMLHLLSIILTFVLGGNRAKEGVSKITLGRKTMRVKWK